MNNKKKVSICMIMRDEEKNLYRCLDSIKPLLDMGLAELIIIDTGSEDNSIKIAKEYTQQVYEHQWTNDFAQMRNISISYAKGEWVWVIDADEAVETSQAMIKLFEADLSHYNTIAIKMKHYIQSEKEGEESQYSMTSLNRVFRNNKELKYTGSIHEQANYKLPLLDSDIIVGHYGYIWEDEEFTKMKFERTAGMLEKALEKDPTNIYYQFQLGTSYSNVDMAEGLKHIRKAYDLVEKLPYTKRSQYLYVYGMYAKIAYVNNKYIEVIKATEEGLAFTKDYIDLWYLKALAYEDMNDEEMTLTTYKAFLECKKGFHKTPLANNPTLTIYFSSDYIEDVVLYKLAETYINKGEYQNAIEYMSKIEPSQLKSELIIALGMKASMNDVILDYLKEIKQEDIMSHFIEILEHENHSQPEKRIIKKDMIEFFATSNICQKSYQFLSTIRMDLINQKTMDKDKVQTIGRLQYDGLADYYGDIVAYIIKNNLELNLFEEIGDPHNVNRFTTYIIEQQEDTCEEIIEYLYKYDHMDDASNLRYWITLARNILVLEEPADDVYLDLFKKYAKKGAVYIGDVYNSIILKEESAYDIYHDEHRFFMYLERANEIKDIDTRETIQYLRKALAAYPMKRGVELLLQEIEKEKKANDHYKNKVRNEFDEYKVIVKNNIKILLEANEIIQAHMLIDEYLKLVPGDQEMLLLRSDVSLQLM